MDRGDRIGLTGVAGVANSGGLEALAVLCLCDTFHGLVGQENTGCAYVSYIRKWVKHGLWISDCSAWGPMDAQKTHGNPKKATLR